MVTITVNTAHPKFAGLDPKKIQVVVGSVGVSPTFYPFLTRALTFESLGEAGTNDRIFSISTRYPMTFTNEEFALLGSVTLDTLLASTTLSALADFVRKGILVVAKDGIALTYAQVIAYTP